VSVPIDQPAAAEPAPAVPPEAAVDPRPEIKVGKAFAGGLVAAMFLKRLARRRHR
jgi:hypothetical protein